MSNKKNRALVLVLTIGLAACLDMDVVNVNAPDADRALADAEDVESLLGGAFNTWWSTTMKVDAPIMLSVAAEELSSAWGNWNMSTAAFFPRSEWPNSLGTAGVHGATWSGLYRSLSSVNDALAALEAGLDFGPDGVNNTRVKAFGRFMQGLNHAWVALFFDQGYILDETIDLSDGIPEMVPYDSIFSAAMHYFDEALALAEANSFSLPSSWFNGTSVDNQDLVRLIHSFKARYIPHLARTPQEREAVDWRKVLHHAENGVTSNWRIPGSGDGIWYHGVLYYGYQQIWTRVSYMIIGPADTTGAFERWYNLENLNDRREFIVETPDRRIHAPGKPLEPGTDFYYYGPSNFFPAAPSYVDSYYLPRRYPHWTNRLDEMPAFEARELDFIKAEAHLRLGEPELAAALINKTRVGRGGLDPVNANDPALLEKLIYEKRIELYAVGAGISYFDARGWGLLHEGTPLHFPVPGRDLELLEMEAYTFGGNMPDAAAPRSIMPKVF